MIYTYIYILFICILAWIITYSPHTWCFQIQWAFELLDSMSEVPPFDWLHAELDAIRDFLVSEAQEGRFKPSVGIPLWGWSGQICNWLCFPNQCKIKWDRCGCLVHLKGVVELFRICGIPTLKEMISIGKDDNTFGDDPLMFLCHSRCEGPQPIYIYTYVISYIYIYMSYIYI